MTMYLSCLLIDTGMNADRPRPGRLWLRNLYHVHQRLCMAFPSAQRKAEDPDFLEPYQADDFPQHDVHVARKEDAGFLFRVDPQPGGRIAILVLSANQPDWEYAFHNAQYLLAAPPSMAQPLEVSFHVGQKFRFRLVANPTRKIDTKSGPQGQRRHGRRVPVLSSDAALRNWLECRAEAGGFRLGDLTLIQPGYVHVNKAHAAGKGLRYRSVRYEGLIEVTDTERFRLAIAGGIGPAKAFGFGLMSIAPSR